MHAQQASWTRLAGIQRALERAIERQVKQRTWGRIRALEVTVIQNRVIIRGRAPSYYVEQLALQGVLDVIGSTGAMQTELNIQVDSPATSARESPPVLAGNRRTESGRASEQPLMNDHARDPADRDSLLDAFAAELTHAAYEVALRHGAAGRWLDLELDLWQVLADTVQKWGWNGRDHLLNPHTDRVIPSDGSGT